jgi:sec-independent protein translocase protein TatA
MGYAKTRCYARVVPFGIGATEIVILLIVALLVFGPKRLPEMGRSLGKGMREFKDSISGKDTEVRELPPVEDERARERERDTVA